MNPRGALLALLYVLGLSAHQLAAADDVPTSSRFPVGGIADDLLSGKRITPTPTPGMYAEADTIQRNMRIVLAKSVKSNARPNSSLWNSMKSGAVGGTVSRAVKFAPTAGRLIGYGGLMQIGAVAVNAGLSYMMEEMQNEINPALKPCIEYSKQNNYPLTPYDMHCGESFESPDNSWPGPGIIPAPDTGEISWANDENGYFNVGVGRNSYGETFVVGNGYCRTTGNPYNVFIRLPSGQPLSAATAELNAHYRNFTDCTRRPKPDIITPIPYDKWISGEYKNGTPHPEAETGLDEAMQKYIERAPIGIGGAPDDFMPGIKLIPQPKQNQLTGLPSNPIADGDGDGWSDLEEVLRGSDPNSKTSKPDPKADTDRDGVPDGIEDEKGTNPYDPNDRPDYDPALDLDGDGEPDVTDPDLDGDGVPNVDDPEPENKNVPVTCGTGYKPSGDGKSCEPVTDPVKCPEGSTLTDGKCVTEDGKEKDPVGDECGNFTVPRLMSHTGHFIRDIFFSCDRQGMEELAVLVSSKFPFSLIGSLNGLVTADGGNGENPLPPKIGPFELDWLFASSFFAFAKIAFRAVLWFMFASWLIGRLSGQVVLQ